MLRSKEAWCSIHIVFVLDNSQKHSHISMPGVEVANRVVSIVCSFSCLDDIAHKINDVIHVSISSVKVHIG